MKIRHYIGVFGFCLSLALTSGMAANAQEEVQTPTVEVIEAEIAPIEILEPEPIIEEIEETTVEEVEIDETELRYMASIIFAEAGNQCLAGQQAVGIVVMNRVNSSKFKNSIYDVIYEKGQFSPVKDGNLDRALAKYDNGEIPESCIEAAKYVLQGNTLVCYKDIIYEMNDYLFFSRYVKNARLIIESHMFK